MRRAARSEAQRRSSSTGFGGRSLQTPIWLRRLSRSPPCPPEPSRVCRSARLSARSFFFSEASILTNLHLLAGNQVLSHCGVDLFPLRDGRHNLLRIQVGEPDALYFVRG